MRSMGLRKALPDRKAISWPSSIRKRPIASSGLRWPVAGVEAMRIFIWPVTFVGETGRPFGGSEGSAHAAKAGALRLRRDFEGHAKWLRLQYEMALRRRQCRPHQPRARWNSADTNIGLPFQKRLGRHDQAAAAKRYPCRSRRLRPGSSHRRREASHG